MGNTVVWKPASSQQFAAPILMELLARHDGDQVLVIQYPTGPRLFTQAQVASSRYERYLTR